MMNTQDVGSSSLLQECDNLQSLNSTVRSERSYLKRSIDLTTPITAASPKRLQSETPVATSTIKPSQDRDAFYKRLESFSSAFVGRARPLNAVECAMHGFVDTHEVEKKHNICKLSCTSCNCSNFVVDVTGFERGAPGMVQKFRDQYVNDLNKLHRADCFWKYDKCSDDIYAFPIQTSVEALDLMKTEGSRLLSFPGLLPTAQHPMTSEQLKKLDMVIRGPEHLTEFQAMLQDIPDSQRVPYIYALFGWRLSLEDVPSLKCHQCFKWVPNSARSQFDVVSEHMDYCPWVNRDQAMVRRPTGNLGFVTGYEWMVAIVEQEYSFMFYMREKSEAYQEARLNYIKAYRRQIQEDRAAFERNFPDSPDSLPDTNVSISQAEAAIENQADKEQPAIEATQELPEQSTAAAAPEEPCKETPVMGTAQEVRNDPSAIEANEEISKGLYMEAGEEVFEESSTSEIVEKVSNNATGAETTEKVSEVPSTIESAEVSKETSAMEPVEEDSNESIVTAPTKEAYMEPIVLGPTETVSEEPVVVEPVEEVSKESVSVEITEGVSEEPVVIESTEEASEKPVVIESTEGVSEEPAVTEPTKRVSEEPTVVEATEEVSEESTIIEPAEEVSEEPTIIEPAEELSEEPAVVEPTKDVSEEPTIIEAAEEISKTPPGTDDVAKELRAGVTSDKALEEHDLKGAEAIDVQQKEDTADEATLPVITITAEEEQSKKETELDQLDDELIDYMESEIEHDASLSTVAEGKVDEAPEEEIDESILEDVETPADAEGEILASKSDDDQDKSVQIEEIDDLGEDEVEASLPTVTPADDVRSVPSNENRDGMDEETSQAPERTVPHVGTNSKYDAKNDEVHEIQGTVSVSPPQLQQDEFLEEDHEDQYKNESDALDELEESPQETHDKDAEDSQLEALTPTETTNDEGASVQATIATELDTTETTNDDDIAAKSNAAAEADTTERDDDADGDKPADMNVDADLEEVKIQPSTTTEVQGLASVPTPNQLPIVASGLGNVPASVEQNVSNADDRSMGGYENDIDMATEGEVDERDDVDMGGDGYGEESEVGGMAGVEERDAQMILDEDMDMESR